MDCEWLPPLGRAGAMSQFCCRLSDTKLTVQLQIGKEERTLRAYMHNGFTEELREERR